MNEMNRINDFVSGRTYNTRKTYLYVLTNLFSLLEDIEIKVDNCIQIEERIRHFVSDTKSSQTRNLKIGVISNYFKKFYKFDPTINIKRDSYNTHIKLRGKTNQKELETAFSLIDIKTLKGQRDIALLLVLLESDQTLTEMCYQKIDDFEINSDTDIILHCKNGKIVNLSSIASIAVYNWIKTLNAESGDIWASFSPKMKGLNVNMSSRGMSAVVKSYFNSIPRLDTKEDIIEAIKNIKK